MKDYNKFKRKVRDFDALAPAGARHTPADEVPINYINKRKQRGGTEVVFNPQGHRYVRVCVGGGVNVAAR